MASEKRPLRESRRLRLPRIMILALLSASCIVGLATVHNFLALSTPVRQGILVVEAWIPKASRADSLEAFRKGSYRYLVVVGGPIGEGSGDVDGTATNADSAASDLERLGFDSSRLVKISVPASEHRSMANAIAFKQWLTDSGVSLRSIDVFTVGVHARKSWILFRYILGNTFQVGVISAPERSYDAQRWLASPTGIRIVFRNLAGYIYSQLGILMTA